MWTHSGVGQRDAYYNRANAKSLRWLQGSGREIHGSIGKWHSLRPTFSRIEPNGPPSPLKAHKNCSWPKQRKLVRRYNSIDSSHGSWSAWLFLLFLSPSPPLSPSLATSWTNISHHRSVQRLTTTNTTTHADDTIGTNKPTESEHGGISALESSDSTTGKTCTTNNGTSPIITCGTEWECWKRFRYNNSIFSSSETTKCSLIAPDAYSLALALSVSLNYYKLLSF